MNINYPAEYEIGDIAFTCIGAALFGQISAASNCWSNHVGIIIGHNGEDFLVAESRVPLSTITTLSGNDSNLLIVFYVQIMPDDFVMQLHRF